MSQRPRAIDPRSRIAQLRSFRRLSAVGELSLLLPLSLSLLAEDSPLAFRPFTLTRTVAGLALYVLLLMAPIEYVWHAEAEGRRPWESLILAVSRPLTRAGAGAAILLAVVVPFAAIGFYGLPVTAVTVIVLSWFFLYLTATRVPAPKDWGCSPLSGDLGRLGSEVGLPEVAMGPMQALPDEVGVCSAEHHGKQIVFVDPRLPELLNPRELRVLFAHEVSHLRLSHFRVARRVQTLATTCGALLAACGILPLISTRSESWASAVIDFLPLLLTWVLLGQLAVAPATLAISRAQERQANHLALELTGDPSAFLSACTKLARHTGADRPVGLLGRLTGTHPPLDNVVEQARRFAAERGIPLEESAGGAGGG